MQLQVLSDQKHDFTWHKLNCAILAWRGITRRRHCFLSRYLFCSSYKIICSLLQKQLHFGKRKYYFELFTILTLPGHLDFFWKLKYIYDATTCIKWKKTWFAILFHLNLPERVCFFLTLKDTLNKYSY